jgi:hypothetical protein
VLGWTSVAESVVAPHFITEHRENEVVEMVEKTQEILNMTGERVCYLCHNKESEIRAVGLFDCFHAGRAIYSEDKCKWYETFETCNEGVCTLCESRHRMQQEAWARADARNPY